MNCSLSLTTTSHEFFHILYLFAISKLEIVRHKGVPEEPSKTPDFIVQFRVDQTRLALEGKGKPDHAIGKDLCPAQQLEPISVPREMDHPQGGFHSFPSVAPGESVEKFIDDRIDVGGDEKIDQPEGNDAEEITLNLKDSGGLVKANCNLKALFLKGILDF